MVERRALRSILDDGKRRMRAQSLAAVEGVELDDESAGDDFSTETLNQFYRRAGSATGGEQIINDKYAGRLAKGVLVNLQPVLTVFQSILGGEGQRRQLTRLTHHRHATAKRIGHRRSDDETARFDTEHHIDLALIALCDHIDDAPQRFTIRQQGCDVAKNDPGLWKIRDVADVLFEIDHGSSVYQIDGNGDSLGIPTITGDSRDAG